MRRKEREGDTREEIEKSVEEEDDEKEKRGGDLFIITRWNKTTSLTGSITKNVVTFIFKLKYLN